MINLRVLVRRALATMAIFAAVLIYLLAAAGSAVAQTQTAVEYYYSAWNFYFETSFPDEIAALDGGAFGGAWKRTGQTFNVWPQAVAGSVPTCRFFSTAFGARSAHFYTPYAAECLGLQTAPVLTSVWQLETPAAFYIALTDANGNCPAGLVPLYRVYNNGMGGAPNHRYTTDAAIRALMITQGWVSEGNGPDTIFACVPPTAIANTAEGLWFGGTNTNSTIAGIVLDTGTFYFLYSVIGNPNLIAGVVQGSGVSDNGQFSSSNAVDFNITGNGVINTAVAGIYVAQSSLDGVITSSLDSASFTTTYQPVYEQPASLSAAAGTYTGQVASSAGVQSATVTLDATGTLLGASLGCSFNGIATPHGAVNVFDLSVTFQGGMCIFGTSTLFGIAYYNITKNVIYGTAPNASRTDGFLFVGTKP